MLFLHHKGHMDKDRSPVTSLVHTSLLRRQPEEICAIELIKAGLDKENRGDIACIDRSVVMMCQRGIKMPFTQFGCFNDFNINSALSQKKAIFYLRFFGPCDYHECQKLFNAYKSIP